MKKFNKDKYLRKLKIKRFFRNNSRYFYIVLLCFLCGFLGIYFTYSKFFISDEQEVIRTTVGDFRKSDIVLNFYIDGKKVEDAPAKYNGYDFSNASCTSGKVKWSNDDWRLTVENLEERTKCDIYFIENLTYEFAYTGNEEEALISKSGLYKLETWGSQGGSAYNGYSSPTLRAGGSGGYATGIVSLNKGDKLYVNVGGGADTITDRMVSGRVWPGGYNGGGAGKEYANGGGATHIAKKSGVLSTLENNIDDILIVAGGGGGTSADTNGGGYCYGGGGGGMNGVNGTKIGTYYSVKAGDGGKQDSGYAFGLGETPESKNDAGGGGGLYGGTIGNNNSSFDACAGGGSGYIGNSLLTNKTMYCYKCTTSSEYATKTETTTCNEETPTENCSKKGNGYAKMTYIPLTIEYYVDNVKQDTLPSKNNNVFKEITCDKSSNITWDEDNWSFSITDYKENDVCRIFFSISFTFAYTAEEQEFLAEKNGSYKLEAWGAQGGGNTRYQGGYGAYASGIVYLNKNDKLYINVGGAGTINAISSGTTSFTAGGYNGGGNSTSGGDSGYTAGGGSGGGSTHIAKVSGLLSVLENNKNDILIIAAGGGGANINSYDNNSLSHVGGSAGGISSTSKSGEKTSCTSATQIAGFSFGLGGNYLSNVHGAAGGGGGYYGGGGGSVNGPGCGGSSYIGNSLLSNKVMYCYNCTASTDVDTKTETTTCNEETPTGNCAKKGNGYAKIIYLGESE